MAKKEQDYDFRTLTKVIIGILIFTVYAIKGIIEIIKGIILLINKIRNRKKKGINKVNINKNNSNKENNDLIKIKVLEEMIKNDNDNTNKESRYTDEELENYGLSEDEKEIVKNSEYEPWNFDEDNIDEDSYYYEDDL